MRIRLKELKCRRCGHTWIPRQDVIKMCPKCKSLGWNISPRKERDMHLETKEVGVKFLNNLGCRDISTEYTYGQNGKRGKGYLRFDVVGRLNDQMIVVECGGMVKGKKRKLQKLLDSRELAKVYILGYGDPMPYEWRLDIPFCPNCGHQWYL